jgi:hypothetical protein
MKREMTSDGRSVGFSIILTTGVLMCIGWMVGRLTPYWIARYRGERAVLAYANLSMARLAGARLQGANLRWADLRDADLRGARLYGADLRGADLTGADLTGARFWGALHDRATRWPEGFDPRRRGLIRIRWRWRE